MTWDMTFIAGLGLLVGSFVNVVIHRMPRMIMHDSTPQSTSGRYDLCWPGSHCPNCQTPLQLWQNIPLLSFILLKGKCFFCKKHISSQYPLIELATSLLWLFSFWRWGINCTGLSWAVYCTLLLALAVIDYQTTLLPDDLTQSLMWGGIAAASLGWIELPLLQSVWGAMIGYTSLWAIAFIFERITQKQGMGAGDFKLFAALGSWLGPLALLPIILMASLSGAIMGISLQLRNRLASDGYLPFGPFLTIAGFTVAVVGTNKVAAILGWHLLA